MSESQTHLTKTSGLPSGGQSVCLFLVFGLFAAGAVAQDAHYWTRQ